MRLSRFLDLLQNQCTHIMGFKHFRLLKRPLATFKQDFAFMCDLAFNPVAAADIQQTRVV